MIYGFQRGVLYSCDDYSKLYFIPDATIQWTEYWEIRGVWYHKVDDHRYSADRFTVPKTYLEKWHYGKYGPC